MHSYLLYYSKLQVYVVAGGREGYPHYEYLASTEVHFPRSSSWMESGALPSPRRGLRGVNIGQHFYVTGAYVS